MGLNGIETQSFFFKDKQAKEKYWLTGETANKNSHQLIQFNHIEIYAGTRKTLVYSSNQFVKRNNKM